MSHFLLGIREADEQSRRAVRNGNSLMVESTMHSPQTTSLRFASFVQGMDEFLPDGSDYEEGDSAGMGDVDSQEGNEAVGSQFVSASLSNIGSGGSTGSAVTD